METFATTAENRKVTAAFWYPADANTKYEFRTRHDFKEYQREQDGDLLGEYLGVKDGKPLINHDIYAVPILNIWTDDMKRGFDAIKDPSIELPQKQILATAPKAYEAYFAGTYHMSLTDLPLISPLAVKLISGSFGKMSGEAAADKVYVIKTMNRLVLEFFDANLKGQGIFRSAGTY